MCGKKTCAAVENFEKILDLSSNECFRQIRNIVHNWSYPHHTSVHSFIVRSSISSVIVSYKIARPYAKSVSRIKKADMKKLESDFLDFHTTKQKIEEHLLNGARKK